MCWSKIFRSRSPSGDAKRQKRAKISDLYSKISDSDTSIHLYSSDWTLHLRPIHKYNHHASITAFPPIAINPHLPLHLPLPLLQHNTAMPRKIQHETPRPRAQRHPTLPLRLLTLLQTIQLRALRSAKNPVRKHGILEKRDQNPPLLASQRPPKTSVVRLPREIY